MDRSPDSPSPELMNRPTSSGPTRRQLTMIGLVVIPLALILRLWGIANEPVWLDEVHSVRLSTGSAAAILDANAKDVHPPAFYLGLNSWRSVFGSTAVGLRTYSLLWSLLGISFILLLATSLGLDWRGVFLAGLLAAIHPLDIFFAQEARMYAQAAALGTASSWFLWLWLTSRVPNRWQAQSGIWLAAYALAASILLQTLYLGGFILLAQGLFVFIHCTIRRDWRGPTAYAGATLTTLLLLLPWLFYVRRHGPHPLGRVEWLPEPSFEFLLTPFVRELFVGRVVGGEMSFFLLLLFSAALLLVLFVALDLTRVWRSPTIQSIPFLFWMTCVPLILVFLVSHVLQPVFSRVRFPILILPYFLILAATAVMQLRPGMRRWGTALLLLVAMGSGTVIQHRQITKPGMAHFADIYRRLGPPDHVVLFPSARTITASYHLGQPIQNASQGAIERSLSNQQEVVLWIGTEEGYWLQADPRIRRVYDWLLALGPAERLGVVDGMEMWQITAQQTD